MDSTQAKFHVKRSNGTTAGEFHTLNRALWFCGMMNLSHVEHVNVPVTGHVQSRAAVSQVQG